VHGWIGPWCSFELPLRKPKLFRRAVHALEVVDAVVRDKHLEADTRIVVVSENPVDHVTAITRTGSANTITINIRTATQHIGNAVHEVDKNLTTPIAANLVGKLLTI